VATVEEITDPHLAAFTSPPRRGAGACDICHNAPWTGSMRCWSCVQTTSAVSHPVELVVPISLYQVGGQLHNVLASYKRSLDVRVRAQFGTLIAATLSRFIGEHGDHIREAAGTDWDTTTIVPSKSRPGPHALQQAVELSARLRETFGPVVEPWEPQTISRATASDRGYRAIRRLDGERVLLLDDTFTSGATLQSAASAIGLAGGQVVASVVVGRVIHPEFSTEMGEMWERQRKVTFDFGSCCLE
jgi:predicted amidophosphoribosyltransferase